MLPTPELIGLHITSIPREIWGIFHLKQDEQSSSALWGWFQFQWALQLRCIVLSQLMLLPKRVWNLDTALGAQKVALSPRIQQEFWSFWAFWSHSFRVELRHVNVTILSPPPSQPLERNSLGYYFDCIVHGTNWEKMGKVVMATPDSEYSKPNIA